MANDTTYCIYRIVCFVTGKCYIGQTSRQRRRKKEHLATSNITDIAIVTCSVPTTNTVDNHFTLRFSKARFHLMK